MAYDASSEVPKRLLGRGFQKQGGGKPGGKESDAGCQEPAMGVPSMGVS